MPNMIYYAIRHKSTGELMPQFKKDRGYSHWNPSISDKKYKQALGFPRLFSVRRRAARCIICWAAFPNGLHFGYQTYYGEWEENIIFKPDGRSKEDLEVVEVSIEIRENA